MKRLLAVVCAVGALSFAVAAPATAAGHKAPVTTSPSPKSGSSGSTTGSDGGTDSSDGNSEYTTVKTCSLYANSSGFGMSCLGGGDGKAQTLAQLLGKVDPPRCWDTYLTPDVATNKYDVPVPPDATYNVFFHSCFVHPLDKSKPLLGQDLSLTQFPIEIQKTNSHPCPAGDVANPKPNEFYGIAMTCYLQIRPPQNKVTGTVADDANIPNISIETSPALNKVRTRVLTSFIDDAVCTPKACTQHGRRTANQNVGGGVTMWAQMDSFKILPFGPYSKTADPTNGRAAVSSTMNPNVPIAAHYTYDESSAGQPGLYYPFRAVATWTVKYDDGGGVHTLATFHKYDDRKLHVGDVQALVIP